MIQDKHTIDQVTVAGKVELDESQLDEIQGGLLPAVKPSDIASQDIHFTSLNYLKIQPAPNP